MGNSPRDCSPGGQWLGFIFIWWGVVLEPSWRPSPHSVLQSSDFFFFLQFKQFKIILNMHYAWTVLVIMVFLCFSCCQNFMDWKVNSSPSSSWFLPQFYRVQLNHTNVKVSLELDTKNNNNRILMFHVKTLIWFTKNTVCKLNVSPSQLSVMFVNLYIKNMICFYFILFIYLLFILSFGYDDLLYPPHSVQVHN